MKIRLTLLSLNVLCGTFYDPLPIKRHIQQAKKIRAINPDIICLQEFNNPYIEKIYTKELLDRYNLYIERSSMKEMMRRFYIMSFLCVSVLKIYSPILYILLNPYIHNFVIGSQKIGNVLFIRKEISMVKIKTKEFRTQTGDILNIFRKRGYTECVIYNKIHIRNVHLNHILNSEKNKNKNSQDQLLETFSDLPTKYNLIVGDFNVENINGPDDFKDCCKNLGNTYRKDNKLTCNNIRDKRIDYIFGRNIDIISAKRLTNLESDHDALFITFVV